LEKSKTTQSQSPSAFGTFGIVLDGELLGYHYLAKKHFHKRLTEVKSD
jgi:hypothetical protein